MSACTCLNGMKGGGDKALAFAFVLAGWGVGGCGGYSLTFVCGLLASGYRSLN